MRSYISSFKRRLMAFRREAEPGHGFRHNALKRAPKSPCAKVFLLTAAIFLTVFLLIELSWRNIGVNQLSVTDDMRLWSMEREKVDSNLSEDTVVLLGGSRMQLGFSADSFKRKYPDKQLIRLGVAGKKPMAALRDIADNTNFSGTVIISVYTMALLPKSMKDQQAYVDYYHLNWSLDAEINRRIKTYLEMNLVSINPRYRVVDLFKYAIGNRPKPKQHYLTIQSDRSFYGDYEARNPDQNIIAVKKRLKPFKKKRKASLTPQEWYEKAITTEKYVQKIVERGGKVVFVRFPISYDDWTKMHGQMFPKEKYWDAYAADSQSTMIHFADYPELHFNSPDASHLDMRASPVFTENLFEVLEKKGVF